ncbi:MAG: hypothetical protein JO036_17965 [Candidatus Eremiobacteraeota bacterium]|nr:hypothetical protein [Candidatus Eremiobacteraeota bacterium]
MPTLGAAAELTLPGGLVTDELSVRRVALAPLDGFGEDWLARHAGCCSAEATTALLGLCLAPPDGLDATQFARELLAGDRDFLMLHLRRLTLGDRVQAVLRCPACAQKIDVEFDARDVEVEAHQQSARTYALTVDGRAVRYRLPNGADQEAVGRLDAERGAQALFERCIAADGTLPLGEEARATIIGAMEANAPKIDLELEVSCPECAHAFVSPFDVTAFFLAEMRVRGERLLREVHALALHYHWSEADILALRRDRRHAYLALINETARA